MKSKRTIATTPEARHLVPWCLSGARTALTIGKAIRDRLKALQAYSPYVPQPECNTELHAMRIAAKRLHYTMQACASLYPDSLRAPVRTVRALQTLLGDIHDVTCGRMTCRNFSPPSATAYWCTLGR